MKPVLVTMSTKLVRTGTLEMTNVPSAAVVTQDSALLCGGAVQLPSACTAENGNAQTCAPGTAGGPPSSPLKLPASSPLSVVAALSVAAPLSVAVPLSIVPPPSDAASAIAPASPPSGDASGPPSPRKAPAPVTRAVPQVREMFPPSGMGMAPSDAAPSALASATVLVSEAPASACGAAGLDEELHPSIKASAPAGTASKQTNVTQLSLAIASPFGSKRKHSPTRHAGLGSQLCVHVKSYGFMGSSSGTIVPPTMHIS